MTRALLAFAVALACLAPSATFAQDGRRAMQRYGCATCHQVEGIRVSRGQSCVGCHENIIENQRRRGRAPSVRHYVHVPDLDTAGRRLREDYLVSFLQDPHDVRPRLEETMPRLPVTEADARVIASFLRRRAPRVASGPAPQRSNLAAGRAAFERVGCATCHELGNIDFGLNIPPEALMGLGQAAYEAPNLRFVRDRMDADVALAWILDPQSIDPDAQMPATDLSRENAILIRDFLWFADPGRAARSTAEHVDLRPLDRPVRFAEVRRLFHQSCIHCHAHTDGRSASAMGFEPSSLDLSTPEGVRAGVLLPDGSRRSILEPDESGMPPLVHRLMQRHDEATRDITTPRHDPLTPVVRSRPAGIVGMPLGLPPMDGDDIRIIATWIAQGAL